LLNPESRNLSRRVPRNYRGTRTDRNYTREFVIGRANRECIIHKTPPLATGCTAEPRSDAFFRQIRVAVIQDGDRGVLVWKIEPDSVYLSYRPLARSWEISKLLAILNNSSRIPANSGNAPPRLLGISLGDSFRERVFASRRDDPARAPGKLAPHLINRDSGRAGKRIN